jgi:basic membrane lipoprotein Med (substrate-binding protein (PBP1-ABC) superfamily)
LADGGADISPLYNWEEDLPAEVVDAVNQARQDIIDGNLVVPLKVEPLE